MEKTFKIGRYDVKIKDELTWFQQEEIKGMFIGSAKMDTKQGGSVNIVGMDGQASIQAQIKSFEFSIAEIKEGEKVIPFSEQWVKQLTASEGDLLVTSINTAQKKS
jgi:hypothetical protein